MHELSIAHSIVQAVAEIALESNIEHIDAVHLQIGLLSGVVKDALLFSYDVVAEGTCLEGSHLVIEELPVVIFCETCQAEQKLESIQRFRCPVCDTPSADIRQGKELEIIGIEVYDETETART